MRHQRTGKKLGRDSAHRKALYANLAGALIEHGRIKTTVTKAKAVKPIAEQMITLGRRGDLHARRQAIVVPALAGRRAQAVRRGRAAVRRPARRLLADRQARPARRATPPRWPTSSSSTRSTSQRSARSARRRAVAAEPGRGRGGAPRPTRPRRRGARGRQTSRPRPRRAAEAPRTTRAARAEPAAEAEAKCRCRHSGLSGVGSSARADQGADERDHRAAERDGASERTKLVSKKRQRSTASPISSNATTIAAATSAAW